METKITMTRWANGRGVDLRFERGHERPASRISLNADEIEQLRDLLADIEPKHQPIYAKLPKRND